MGEIKSTLDLVMERTRHMSLSAEEKAKQQQAEFEKRLSGLLQQYADNVLTLNEVQSRITELQQKKNVSDLKVVITAVLARVDLDQENEHWLVLLDKLKPVACDPLKNILSAYDKQKNGLLQNSARQMSDRLSRSLGIRGSAVVPNPLKDSQYRNELAILQKETRIRIKAITK
jgi:hypothetical protein